MTSLKAVVISLAFIVNDINMTITGTTHKYLGAALIYLISVAILVGQLKLFSASYWKTHPIFCVCIEVLFAVTVLEFFFGIVWHKIQDFISSNAENFLQQLTEWRGLDGVICYMCCDNKLDCAQLLTNFCLSFFSFALLAVTSTLLA